MKKVVLFILMLFLLITKVYASDYGCSISGDDYIHPYTESESNVFNKTKAYIDITNIKDISSFTMIIEYDKDLYNVDSCYLLNNKDKKCTLNKNTLNYEYKYVYSSKYDFENYKLINLILLSNEDTPDTGSTLVNVSFEDAKDVSGKEITIDSCSKTFTFKDYSDLYVPSENEEIQEEENTSNYIKNMTIKGYEFDFDKNTEDYTLKVESEVNKLDIEIELESETSKYSITGASNLSSFGNKVIISVKNSNNEERIYTINVLREKEVIKKTDLKAEIKGILNNPTFRTILPYGLLALIIALSIILIIRKRGSSKMDKYLDNL